MFLFVCVCVCVCVCVRNRKKLVSTDQRKKKVQVGKILVLLPFA